MRHLKENELIDVLFAELHDSALDAHLADCEECAAKLRHLESGMDAARAVEPKVPLMALPPITYKNFERRRKSFRKLWFAAAAILVMGLMGFRMEVGDGKMTMEFAFFGRGGDSVSEARIEDLEKSLMMAMDAIEVQSTMTQQQMDARFNQLYLDQNREYNDLQAVLARYGKNTQLENQSHLAAMKEQLIEEVRKAGFKGQLQ